MTYASEVLADTPLIYWPLNDPSGTTAADSSGNSRVGTYVNGVTLSASGARVDGDKAVSLDGTNDHITSTYTPFAGSASRTFEICYNRTNTSTDDCLFSSAGGGIMLRLPSGSSDVLFFPDTGGSSTNWTAASPGTAQWVHLVLLFNDSAHTAELYINGVSKGQNTGVTTQTSTGNVVVGARGTSADFFLGGLDEFAAYTGLLSAGRILAHYQALTVLPAALWSVF